MVVFFLKSQLGKRTKNTHMGVCVCFRGSAAMQNLLRLLVEDRPN